MPIQSMMLCLSANPKDGPSEDDSFMISAVVFPFVVKQNTPVEIVALLSVFPDLEFNEILSFRMFFVSRRRTLVEVPTFSAMAKDLMHGQNPYLLSVPIVLPVLPLGVYAIEAVGQLSSSDCPKVEARYVFHIVSGEST